MGDARGVRSASALGVAMSLADVYAKVDTLQPDDATTPLMPRPKVLDR